MGQPVSIRYGAGCGEFWRECAGLAERSRAGAWGEGRGGGCGLAPKGLLLGILRLANHTRACLYAAFQGDAAMAETFELKYERATTYKSATVDSAVITVIGDLYGAHVNLNFARLDSNIVSETMTKDEGKLTPIPNRPPKAEPIKTLEFTAVMRPDQAFAVLVALRSALGNLPEPVRRQFRMNDELLNIPSDKGV